MRLPYRSSVYAIGSRLARIINRESGKLMSSKGEPNRDGIAGNAQIPGLIEAQFVLRLVKESKAVVVEGCYGNQQRGKNGGKP